MSVLLPAWNAGPSLGAALRSVERQSESHFECVVVDDGSTDATPEIAERLAASDPRFRVIRSPHEGLVGALSRGLRECRAPLVARMDADDCMHRDRLRLQCAALDADPGLAGLGCHVRLFPRDDLSGGMRRYESWLNGLRSANDVERDRFIECPLAHPTLVLRSEVLRAHGYRDVGWPEDYDLVLRLLGAGQRLGVVPRRLHGWRDSPSRLSRRSPAYADDRFVACKASFLAERFLAGSDAYVLWGYGDTGRVLRRHLQARNKRPSHVVELHPGRLGQRIHGAPVVAPDALPGLRSRPIVVSVAGAGPRAEIRAALAGMGFVDTRDFVCAA